MPAPILPTAVDPGDAAFQANAGGMLGLLGEIDGLLGQASLGGGERAIARHRGRGKLLIMTGWRSSRMSMIQIRRSRKRSWGVRCASHTSTSSPRPGNGIDVSPRGDAPGFVRVLDDHTLVIPDRRGNNRLDSMGNLLVNASWP